MARGRILWLFLTIIGAVGLADSIWIHILSSNYDEFGTACRVAEGFDCAPALSSEWSHFQGIPLSTWGIGLFTFLFLLALQGLFQAKYRGRNALLVASATGVSLFLVARLVYLLVFRLDSYCLYCLIAHLAIFMEFVLSFTAFRLERISAREVMAEEIQSVRRDSRLAAAMLAALVLLLVGIPLMNHREREKLLDAHPHEKAVLEGEAPRIANFLDLVEGREVRGNSNAPVTIVEFGDFTCPVCRSGALVLEELRAEYDLRVAFVAYHQSRECNPAIESTRNGACLSALALAHARGRTDFWQLHDRLFAEPGLLTESHGSELANAAGASSLEDLLADTEAHGRLIADIAVARAFGVRSVPTLIVNGYKIDSLPPKWYLEELIEKEIERNSR